MIVCQACGTPNPVRMQLRSADSSVARHNAPTTVRETAWATAQMFRP
jgi:hypothetical protein